MKNLIAHRGLKLHGIKENSIPAFQAALDHDDYIGFECDIRTSKDGIFVVVHNPIVKDDVVSLTSAKNLKIEHNIPTLQEILELNSDKIFLFEIKEANFNVEKFLEVLQEYPKKKIYIMSFHNSVIRRLARKDRFYKIGVLNYVLNSEESYQDYDFIGLLEAIATPKLVSYFEQKKIDVFFYGIHQLDTLRKEYPTCYFITDKIITAV